MGRFIMIESKEAYSKLIETLNKIGVALSVEKDNTRLLRMIVTGAMDITNADGGTLYLVYKEKQLSFSIIANKSLGIEPAHILETDLPITSVPLYIQGKPNLKNVASYCYHEKKSV